MLIIFALARTGRGSITPAAVGAPIGAAYFFTNSTSFANPAIAIGRMFSNSFADIAASSVPPFISAELVGRLVGFALIAVLYPSSTPEEAQDVVVPRRVESLPISPPEA